MLRTLFLIFESFRFAWGALRENLLRTFLSLLGVSIGIFSIIGVLTLVDTLEGSIKSSLSFIGDKVIYVEKWPWSFTDDYPWWKYMNRPHPTIEEYNFLKDNLSWSSAISASAFRRGSTIKYKNNSTTDISVQGITYGHDKVADIPVERGRYFSFQEAESGSNVALIGAEIAKDLFAEFINPVGQNIKIKGRKFRVIGVLKRQGDNLLGAPSNDNLCMLPFSAMKKMYLSTKRRGIHPVIAVKGFEDDFKRQELEAEIRGLVRMYRGIRPKEKDTFALNRPEMFAVFLDGIIGGLKIGGWFIGFFALLVGGFGIANIMFVSVKERTQIIGIQKSLGAKNFFILFQFLFEAIFLSIIGGAVGLGLVSLITLFSSESFAIQLSGSNMTLGLSVAMIIGLISGLAPAIMAARLNPVEAIRSN